MSLPWVSSPRRRLLCALALAPFCPAAGATQPHLSARHAFVGNDDQTLLALDADTPVQIASITKLVTAWVVLSAGLPLEEPVRIVEDDIVASEFTRSNLALGSSWRRGQLLEWLLVTSDNRAAAALARSYPGGWVEFRYDMRMLVTQMQLFSFDFGDSSGLSTINRASARDLGVLLVTLARQPAFRRLSQQLSVAGQPNINRFAHDGSVALLTGKTGFTSAAGYCLAMAEQFGRDILALVVLKASGKEERAQDMNRLRAYARQALSGASGPGA